MTAGERFGGRSSAVRRRVKSLNLLKTPETGEKRADSVVICRHFAVLRSFFAAFVALK